MNDSVEKRVGRFLSEQMGSGPGEQRLAAQRARLVASMGRGSSRRWAGTPSGWFAGLRGGFDAWPGVGRAFVALAGVALVVALVQHSVGLFGLGVTGELSAQHRGLSLNEDSWVRADARPEELEFSDGTLVTLSPSTRARVASLGREGAVLNLEAGRLEASVVPKTGYRWVFRAGHFRVIVLGTVLRIDWQPTAERLLVEVARGSVRVEDIRQAGPGNVVAAGGRLELGGGAARSLAEPPVAPSGTDDVNSGVVPPQGSPRIESGAAAAPEKAAPEKPLGAVSPRGVIPKLRSGAGTKPLARAAASADPAPQPATPEPRTDRLAWLGLARQGRYVDALSAAQAVGLSELSSSLSAEQMWALADATRLAGAVAESKTVLKALRQRFPGHPRARAATYTLGRIAADTGNDEEAIRWFQTYLGIEGGVASNEAARGRLLIALQRSGRMEEARRTARRYLQRYPEGSFAPIARSVLSTGE